MSNKMQYEGPTLKSFYGWLQILFIAYKLAGIIDWSWWWVLTPAIAVFCLRFFHELGASLKARFKINVK
jgi:hypothetical protein